MAARRAPNPATRPAAFLTSGGDGHEAQPEPATDDPGLLIAQPPPASPIPPHQPHQRSDRRHRCKPWLEDTPGHGRNQAYEPRCSQHSPGRGKEEEKCSVPVAGSQLDDLRLLGEPGGAELGEVSCKVVAVERSDRCQPDGVRREPHEHHAGKARIPLPRTHRSLPSPELFMRARFMTADPSTVRRALAAGWPNGGQ
jgi:hypothetical protein